MCFQFPFISLQPVHFKNNLFSCRQWQFSKIEDQVWESTCRQRPLPLGLLADPSSPGQGGNSVFPSFPSLAGLAPRGLREGLRFPGIFLSPRATHRNMWQSHVLQAGWCPSLPTEDHGPTCSSAEPRSHCSWQCPLHQGSHESREASRGLYGLGGVGGFLGRDQRGA